ncbi:GNAT family N-acetyltransferase [Amycolatopsis sp. H20-H5]|uniref:GNAT family N-acetyltransferase n=1 Tax=Amycolatopsis sp. H20-H5 TaxID=3046309 RepID=UPI002DBF9888|nr:GNAT family N-acetyltransferase [Amycolatopsis sp. H20-H5]MEC3976339.1 GNAT family N-acetyltransferase [Amycolatopsis sp. H20-H5]
MSVTIRRADLAAEAEEITKLLVDYMTVATEQLLSEFGIEDPPTDISGLRASLQEYDDPSRALLVAEDSSGSLVAVAGLRTLEPRVVELKRMYVAPERRGQGVGARLLDSLLEEAARMRASTVRLDTARFMAEAQRLYRSRGFTERTPYQGTEIPPHLQQHWLFFERRG